MIKNLDSLADRLKGIQIDGKDLTPGKLSELLSATEEHELTIGTVHLFNDTELTTLKDNSQKSGYSEGKTAGEEMTIKAIKNAKDLDFEGKTIDNLLSAYETKLKTEFGKGDSEKVKEWESKYNTLKGTYDTEKGAHEEKVNGLNTKLNDFSINSNLHSNMPELTGIKKEHAAMIYRAERTLENREGSLIVKKGSEIVKDTLGNPIPVKDDFTSFAQDQGWIKKGGRGGGNEGGGGSTFKTEDEAFAHMKKNNIDPSSDEGTTIINSIAQE